MKRINYLFVLWSVLLLSGCGGEESHEVPDYMKIINTPCSVKGETRCSETENPMYNYLICQESSSQDNQLVWNIKSCNYWDETCFQVNQEAFCSTPCTEKEGIITDHSNDHMYMCKPDDNGNLYQEEITHYAECTDAPSSLKIDGTFCPIDMTVTYSSNPSHSLDSKSTAPSFCSLNAEDVKTLNCPVIYSICDNPGEAICCGGNAYNCVDEDRINTIFAETERDPILTYNEIQRHADAPIWVINHCKTVTGSTCSIGEEWGAECIMKDETCTIDTEDSDYDASAPYKASRKYYSHCADFRGVTANNCKDFGFNPVHSYCREDKSGNTHVSVRVMKPNVDTSGYKCSEDGTQIIKEEN